MTNKQEDTQLITRWLPEDPKSECHWERTVPFTNDCDLIAVGSQTRHAVASVIQNATDYEILALWHAEAGVEGANWYSQSPYTQWLLSKIATLNLDIRNRVHGGDFKDFILDHEQPESEAIVLQHKNHLEREALRRQMYNMVRPANCEPIYTLGPLIRWVEEDVLSVLSGEK